MRCPVQTENGVPANMPGAPIGWSSGRWNPVLQGANKDNTQRCLVLHARRCPTQPSAFSNSTLVAVRGPMTSLSDCHETSDPELRATRSLSTCHDLSGCCGHGGNGPSGEASIGTWPVLAGLTATGCAVATHGSVRGASASAATMPALASCLACWLAGVGSAGVANSSRAATVSACAASMPAQASLDDVQ